MKKMIITGVVISLMIGIPVANGWDDNRIIKQSMYVDNYMFNYLTDPRWKNVYELSNLSNQTWMMKQDIYRMQSELNIAKSYVKESLPILCKQVRWAAETEMGVRGIQCVHRFITDIGSVFLPWSLPKTDFAPSTPPIYKLLPSPWSLSSGMVDLYVNHQVEKRIWEPIDQQIRGIQHLTDYFIPNKQAAISSKYNEYNATRNALISKTLDYMEINQMSYSAYSSPVAINFFFPITNQRVDTFISGQTFDGLNAWGQRNLDAQRQFYQWLNNPNYQQYQDTFNDPFRKW